MVKADSFPLIVMGADGAVLDLLRMNAKAHLKSVESGILWIVREDTGRVIPADGEPSFASLQFRQNRYEARLQALVRENRNESADKAPLVSGEAGAEPLTKLQAVIRARKRQMPEGSYTTHLFSKGLEKIKKKTGEEAIELILAQTDAETVSEAADLLYHLLVLLTEKKLSIEDVYKELSRRE